MFYKSKFYANNKRALNLMNESKDLIYSYLEAKPDAEGSCYNRIKTIPITDRNQDNGYSNFKFGYNHIVYGYQTANVRIETGSFMGNFSIDATKIDNIKSADLIVFAASNDSIYIADRTLNNNNAWLFDKSIRNVVVVPYEKKKRVYYQFNIEMLLYKKAIIKLRKEDDKLLAIHGDTYTMYKGEQPLIAKDFHEYNIDTSDIDFVMYDGLTSKACFYNFLFNEHTCTEHIATLTKLAAYIWETVADQKETTVSAIYQKIVRAYNKTIKDNVATPVVISARKNNIDSSILDKDGNVVLYVSDNEEFNISQHLKANKTDDMKVYQRVIFYLKRHDYKFNPKWTMAELEIADAYCKKHNIY